MAAHPHDELGVSEELRLPKDIPTPADWSGKEELHPFWLIKREEPDKAANAAIVYDAVEVHVVSDYTAVIRVGSGEDKTILPSLHTFKVTYPFIVNTNDIPPNEEVILTWHDIRPKAAPVKKSKTAFDVIKEKEVKRRRT